MPPPSLKGRPHYYSPTKTEYASIRFDLDADLSSLFGWNTKQVFAWVLATYPSTASNATGTTELSQAVIWDTIINSPAQVDPPSLWALIGRNPYDSPPPGSKKAKAKSKKVKSKSDAPLGVLKLRDQKPKYKIPDPSGHIAHAQNVTLSLGWNVQPWVGGLWWTNHIQIGRWAPLKGGRSKAFSLPGLKGAAGTPSGTKKVEETFVGKGEVPEAGKAEPVVNV
jgi:signal peptidase complex subunit 3